MKAENFSATPSPKVLEMLKTMREKWSGGVPDGEKLYVHLRRVFERGTIRFAIIDWGFRQLIVQVGDVVDEFFRVDSINSDTIEVINLFNQKPEIYQIGGSN
ncbi:hypothetical protein HYY75_04670 [bacterium]|nr:hypothetical protein [bacterium]